MLEIGKCGDKKHNVTYAGEAIDPAGDGGAGEAKTSVVAKMVAIHGDEIVGIAFVFGGEILHEGSHLPMGHISVTYQNRFPKCEAFTLLWLSFKYPCCWIFMSSKCILHSMDCHNLISFNLHTTI